MLNQSQLDALSHIFRDGAEQASQVLSRWVDRPAKIDIQRVTQLELAEAAAVLGEADEPINACVMMINGRFTGHLILAFDDASGWALADLLTNRSTGTSQEWGELERSAALETANIVGCGYLNALARHFAQAGPAADLLPSPPEFVRDYAYAILESAMMDQALNANTIFLTEADFLLEGTPANWNLLFLPDAASLPELQGMLS